MARDILEPSARPRGCVGGRATPPTRREVDSHAANDGWWLLVLAPFRTTVPTEVVRDPLVAQADLVTLYIALDRLWRPVVWPAAEPGGDAASDAASDAAPPIDAERRAIAEAIVAESVSWGALTGAQQDVVSSFAEHVAAVVRGRCGT